MVESTECLNNEAQDAANLDLIRIEVFVSEFRGGNSLNTTIFHLFFCSPDSPQSRSAWFLLAHRTEGHEFTAQSSPSITVVQMNHYQKQAWLSGLVSFPLQWFNVTAGWIVFAFSLIAALSEKHQSCWHLWEWANEQKTLQRRADWISSNLLIKYSFLSFFFFT